MMAKYQGDLFREEPGFDGETIEPEQDHERLKGQLKKVRDVMIDSQWRTLSEIAESVGAPEGAVSARLRDLRKEKFGGYEVNRQRVDGGLYRYQVIDPEEYPF
jgi:hypothetical protein